jgi:hypothetical protein
MGVFAWIFSRSSGVLHWPFQRWRFTLVYLQFHPPWIACVLHILSGALVQWLSKELLVRWAASLFCSLNCSRIMANFEIKTSCVIHWPRHLSTIPVARDLSHIFRELYMNILLTGISFWFVCNMIMYLGTFLDLSFSAKSSLAFCLHTFSLAQVGSVSIIGVWIMLFHHTCRLVSALYIIYSW